MTTLLMVLTPATCFRPLQHASAARYPRSLQHTLQPVRCCIMCSGADRSQADSDDEAASMDWDRAWSRYQLENPAEMEELDVSAVQNALTELVMAEANVRQAEDELYAASKKKADLEAELAALNSFESTPIATQIAGRLALALAFVSLVVRYNSSGAESVAGCLLMPVACALGQV